VAVLANQEFQELGSNIRVVAQREEIQVTGIAPWLNQVAALRVPALVDFVQRTMANPTANNASSPTPLGEATAAPTYPANTEPLSLMVFRLNNAYVDDKQLNVGSNQVRIPGVATLFRQFTGLPNPRGDIQLNPNNLANNSAIGRVARLDALAGGRLPNPGRDQDGVYLAEQPRPLDATSLALAANQPAVIADSRMNAIIVRDRASLQETYRNLVAVLDQPTDMIQLDAFVVDVKASRLEEFGLGLSWGSTGTAGQSADGLSQVTRQFLPGGSPVSGANVILQASRGNQLLANIRALESKGDSEMLTVPSVVTLNNLEATFSSRQNFYVKVTGNQDASLTRVTAETLLKVTPLVAQTGSQNGNDRRIRLLISIQDGSIDASTSAVVDNLPRTMENQISTQAVVRGGDTLVIGGQVVRKRVNRTSGIPILQDIPIFGNLARSRSDEFEQYVRIYVVRPRLLGEDSSQTAGPVNPEEADPISNRVLDRVPDLIRGSGLTPRRSDRSIDLPTPETTGPVRLNSSVPPIAPLVVPVPPAPLPAAPVSEEPETDSKTARPRKETERPEDTQDWNANDPKWRAPGSPLGSVGDGSEKTAPTKPEPANPAVTAPANPPAVAPAVNSPTVASQAARDLEARRIIEFELARTNKAVERLTQEVNQGATGVTQRALERAQGDQASLKAELQRMDPQVRSKREPAESKREPVENKREPAESKPMVSSDNLPQYVEFGRGWLQRQAEKENIWVVSHSIYDTADAARSQIGTGVLEAARIIPIYKPGRAAPQFMLITGPFLSSERANNYINRLKLSDAKAHSVSTLVTSVVPAEKN
jgi:type III secretion protein C